MGTQFPLRPPPKGGGAAPIFGPSVVPNGCSDQDATWCGGRTRPRRLCVKWELRSLLPRRGQSPQIFGPCLLWPNRWIYQDRSWHGGRPHSRRLYVRWGPSIPPQKGVEPPPQFSAHFYCGQTAACIKMPLGTEVGLSPVDFLLDGDPAPSLNFWPMFIIVIVISLEHCTMHSCYWLVQVQVLVFYAFCF